MMRVFTLLVILLLPGCSSFEIHFSRSHTVSAPKKILVGFFENRSMRYNPYVQKNFRDSLSFDFFKLGYETELLTSEKAVETPDAVENNVEKAEDKKETARKDKVPAKAAEKIPPKGPGRDLVRLYCKKYGADVLVSGVLSENDSGDMLNSKISTMVIALVYDRNGDKIGEVTYLFSDTMSDSSVVKSVSRKFAGAIHQKLK